MIPGLVIFLNSTCLVGQNDVDLPLKAGLTADVQYADADNSGSRHYRASLDKFSDAVSTFREEDVELHLSLGDFIDHDFASYKPLVKIIRKAKIPFYYVPGNHDFSVRDDQKQKIPVFQKSSLKYYSFNRKNWKFIILDGSEISTFSRKSGDPQTKRAQAILDSLEKAKAPNAHSWNGGIGKTQKKWLENEIGDSHEEGRNVIIFCHFPVYPENQSENLWNADEIRNIVESGKGKTVFISGHTHRSSHWTSNGVHYISLRGMVEMGENSYAIAEIYSDSVSIKGYGAEKNLRIRW